MNWQPIETAPKDGTKLILYWPEYNNLKGVVATGHYYHSRNFSFDKLSYESKGWMADGYTFIFSDPPEPSHWMPLPEGPEQNNLVEAIERALEA